MRKLLMVILSMVLLFIPFSCEKAQLDEIIASNDVKIEECNYTEIVIHEASDCVLSINEDGSFTITDKEKNTGVTIYGNVDQPGLFDPVCSGGLNITAQGGTGLFSYTLGLYALPMLLTDMNQDGHFTGLCPGWYDWGVIEFEGSININSPMTLHLYPIFEILDITGTFHSASAEFKQYKYWNNMIGFGSNDPSIKP